LNNPEKRYCADVAVLILLWRRTLSMRLLTGDSSGVSSDSALHIRYLIAINDDSVGNLSQELTADDVLKGAGRIWTGGNLGYGGGNNVAADWVCREWTPRYLLILNPDVTLDKEAIEKLVASADSDPQVALIGPVQMVDTGRSIRARRGLRYSRALSILWPVRRRHEKIDYVNGGAMLVRVAALEGDPLFTDEFFLFFEELELCDRLRQRGYKIEVCDDSVVTHEEGGVRMSHHDDDYCPEVAEYFDNLNALRFTRKYCPWWLPSVSIVRLLVKPIVLLARRDLVRLGFWWLAVKDFFLLRVSRFPFQRGWCPRLSGESLHDVPWPKFASRVQHRPVDA
jgi:GT2 family glycosyltransferase